MFALVFFISALLVAIVESSEIKVTPDPILAIQRSTQYHSQDSLGQYSYGYADGQSAKNEIRSADGQIVGSYSYLDPAGKIQNVQYRADPVQGFTASGSNIPAAPGSIALILPEPAKDLPEVSEAKARHLEALKLAEENAKKAIETKLAEVKAAVPAQAEIITVPYSSPIIQPIPAFGYPYAINYAGLQTPQIISTYAAPAPYLVLGSSILKPAQPSKMAEAETKKGEPSGVVAAREAEKEPKSKEN